MARGRLSIKLIEHEKTREKTFKKRVEGLKKKAYEFSILCDIEVCMIIFEPNLKDSPGKVQIWPSDAVRVSSTIGKYIEKSDLDVQTKIFSIFDFFNLRKRKVHDEVAQVRQANFKAKFPPWDDRMDDFSPEEIGSILTKLDLNVEVVKRKIMLMKEVDNQNQHLIQSSKLRTLVPTPTSDYIQAYVPEFPHKELDFGVSRDPFNLQLPSLSPADEALVNLTLSLKSTDKYSRIPMMNNFDFRAQSGIASNSSSSSRGIPNNVMYNPPPLYPVLHDCQRIGMLNNNVMVNGPSNIPVLHDPTSAAMQHNLMFQEPKVPFETCFYTPSIQPETLGAYNQQQLMMPLVVPQMLPSEFTDFYNDINEYENKNKKQRF